MFKRLCDGLMWVAETLSWIAFAALIVTVAWQVSARNLLQTPTIWTSDVAQILFTWLIFVGAAIGLRRHAHYFVDLVPAGHPRLGRLLDWLGILAGAIVAAILIRQGWVLAQIRASGVVQSLGISRFWTFLALPTGGSLMALFVIERALELWRDGTRTQDAAGSR
ncbi:MAG: TRAP transporter small permease [Geminicoccaceae bacterium]|nr:TRAP transporter small permease [Geminicoccaceae bacterium]